MSGVTTTTYYERVKAEVESLRAEVKDLKARLRDERKRHLKRVREFADPSVCATCRATDLRVKHWKNWRKP